MSANSHDSQPSTLDDGIWDWQCAIEVLGVARDFFEFAHGLDALRAIVNAIAGAREALIESGLDVGWEGGMGVGLPGYIPDFGDKEFTRELEAYSERRLEERVRAYAERNERNERT